MKVSTDSGLYVYGPAGPESAATVLMHVWGAWCRRPEMVYAIS